MATIEELQIEIQGSSESASSSLEKLIATLDKLKAKTTDYSGLSKLAEALKPLSNFKFSVTGLSKLPQALEALGNMPDITDKMQKLVDAGNILKQLEKNNLNSFLNSLRKLPEISQLLNEMDLDKFAEQIRKVTDAIRPLATEMEKVSKGFAAFPIRIQKIIESNKGLQASNKQAGNSFTSIGGGLTWAFAKLNLYYYTLRKAVNIISDWIIESNKYQENLNLFTVTMGKAAESAYEYAKAVERVMGVDSSEWMRYQGIFQQILDGFGVLEDKATIMSRNLTQLIYDAASFFNVHIETAALKFQSGLAGELEPLRRWGYALDQATLKQTALNHGIKINFNELTQAQKALLRYVTIMEQSTNVFHDMGATLETPANALRILNQRIVQLRRALGNMLIPILIKVIPYVQAFVQVLTDVANKVATLLGFELTKIDYDRRMVNDIIDLGDAFGDVNEEVAKFKNAMAGIDEINILGKPKQGALAPGLDGFDLDIKLPSIDDWLDKVVDKGTEIYNKVKGIVEKLVPFLAVFTGLFVAEKVISTVNAITLFLRTFKPLIEFQNAFAIALNSGATGFAAFNAGLKGFRSAIPLATKVLIGAGGALVAFTSFKDITYDLTSGTKDLKDVLPQLVLTIAGVGTAMYVALGPIGLVVGAIGALTGAIVGHAKATRDAALKELYDEIGLSSYELAGLTQNLGSEIDKMHSAIQEYSIDIKNLETRFNEYADSFAYNVTRVGESAEENEQIISDTLADLEGMISTVQEKLKTTADMALQEYTKLALMNDGFISEEEKKILDEISNNYASQKSRIEEIQSEITYIYENAMKERGKLTTSELERIQQLINEMTNLASFESKLQAKRSQVLLEDIRTGRRKISKQNVGDIVNEAMEQFRTGYEKLVEWRITQESLYESTLSGASLKKALADVEQAYAKQLADLGANTEAVFRAIQDALINQLPFDEKMFRYSENPILHVLEMIGAHAADIFIPGNFTKELESFNVIWREIEKIQEARRNLTGYKPSSGSKPLPPFETRDFRSIIPPYGTGGFPARGELFIANENGPELLGTIGSRSVVASNQQITEALKAAIKEGMREAGGDSNEGNWTIVIMDESGNVKARDVITAAERKNRRDGKTVIAMGV